MALAEDTLGLGTPKSLGFSVAHNFFRVIFGFGVFFATCLEPRRVWGSGCRAMITG